MTDFAREPLQVVEIIQPLCSRTFGVAPCDAVGDKCWNTDATCKSILNLSLTNNIAMRFVFPAANRGLYNSGRYDGGLALEDGNALLLEDGSKLLLEGFATLGDSEVFQPSSAIPALISVDTAPTVVNIGGGNENISPLGLRAVSNIVIKDFPYNDAGFDPYLSSRSYDPASRGSFWTKWLARNPYYTGYLLRVYDGYFGDRLSDMIKREYSIDKIDYSRDSVQITAKDILRKITDTQVTAPALSSGVLALDITATATTFTVAGAVLSDYPAAGIVRIGNELLSYGSRALSGGNIVFSSVTRANLETTAAAHSQFDTVQRVISYNNWRSVDIIYDLLTTWGKIPAAYIDAADWNAEFLEWRELYYFTGYITEPVEIQKLIGELCQQSLVNVWWDERKQKILYRAQRPNDSTTLLTDADNIVADSFTLTDHPEERVSQVYVYYGLRSPVLNLSEKTNFANAEAILDVDKERQYGEAKVKEIFCRWVVTSAIARSLGTSYLLRYRDTRKRAVFEVTPKDIAENWTGDVIQLQHFMFTQPDGSPKVIPWIITSAETVAQGELYRFEVEDNLGGGRLWEFVADTDTRPSTEIGAWVDAAGTDGAGNLLPFGWV